MIDRQQQNLDWYCADDDGHGGAKLRSHINGGAMLAVLMDIRQELRKINRTLQCEDTVDIPKILRSIRRNTAKPKKKIGAGHD